ncbi:MAG: pitrilysin family protein [Chloroherpetonaceae bacterium]|nr:pitrilysin family protein [Chloroherpetonaceae bacterium]
MNRTFRKALGSKQKALTSSVMTYKEKSTVEKTVLPNGLTVLSEFVPTVRSVSVGIWTNTGSRDEDKSNNGMAHFIEHLVFKGTKNRNFVEISRSLEQVGGYLNAFTTKERTCFYARVLDEFLPTAVDVISDLVFHPTFPKEEVEKEKDVIIEEIKSADDTPDDVIHDDFDKLLYGEHPLGFPIGGTEKSVRGITRKMALDFMQERYTTDQMTLAAAGHVKHETLVKLAQSFIPDRRNPKRPNRTGFPMKAYQKKEREVKKPIQQAHLLLGFPFSRSDKDYYAMNLLNTILGGGMSSRLNLELRERHGLAYSVFSSFLTSDETNLFNVYIGTDKNKLDKSEKLIYQELEKLASKAPSQKELELSKAQLKGGLIMAQESMSSRAGHLSQDFYYFGRFREIAEVIDEVDSVSASDIRTLASHLFDRSKFSVLKYLPKK